MVFQLQESLCVEGEGGNMKLFGEVVRAEKKSFYHKPLSVGIGIGISTLSTQIAMSLKLLVNVKSHNQKSNCASLLEYSTNPTNIGKISSGPPHCYTRDITLLQDKLRITVKVTIMT